MSSPLVAHNKQHRFQGAPLNILHVENFLIRLDKIRLDQVRSDQIKVD